MLTSKVTARQWQLPECSTVSVNEESFTVSCCCCCCLAKSPLRISCRNFKVTDSSCPFCLKACATSLNTRMLKPIVAAAPSARSTDRWLLLPDVLKSKDHHESAKGTTAPECDGMVLWTTDKMREYQQRSTFNVTAPSSTIRRLIHSTPIFSKRQRTNDRASQGF